MAGLLLSLAVPLAAQQEEGSGRIIMGLDFKGNHSIESTVLENAISTTNSSWFARAVPFKWFKIFGEKRIFDERAFVGDVLRIELLYKLSGFLEVRVDTVVKRRPDAVNITFVITEGEPVRVTSLTVTGLDSVAAADEITRNLPLRVGAPFNRFLMTASGDTLVRRLRNRGYPGVLVFRNFDQNARERTARVTLDVSPGQAAEVGTVRVEGTATVDSGYVRSLLATRAGRPFSQEDLYQTQRNLYKTELFQFASVGIDSTRFQTGDSIVPLVIRVREGRMHRVRAGAGYGTTDCFRGGAGWTARNFAGGGGILDITGRVSKLGFASPTGWEFARSSLCPALKDDSIGSRKLNYNATVSLRKQGFLSAQNTGNLSVFADRRSEFQVFLREEVGAGLTITRETARQIPFSLGYKLTYGSTEASDANFCAFFSACTQDDIASLRRKRFLATLSAAVSLPRTDSPIDPRRGYVASAEAAVSSRFIGSSRFQQFVKVVGDIAWYRELTRDVVLSWRLRGGLIFAPEQKFSTQTANFVPPEERFYAGGPNDVRGFQRNELGPVVYVLPDRDSLTPELQDSLTRGLVQPRFSATGGNTLTVGNVELRFPSPVFTSRMRLALFVDAGTVWERGKTDFAPSNIRVTPGVGFRFSTPLGPARLDVAYNGYKTQPGALYLARSDGSLQQVQDNFVRNRPSKFTFQFAIGNPF
ncbi:MAG: outer membrane protein assembly factor [Gemmatimonadales bacterium]